MNTVWIANWVGAPIVASSEQAAWNALAEAIANRAAYFADVGLDPENATWRALVGTAVTEVEVRS